MWVDHKADKVTSLPIKFSGDLKASPNHRLEFHANEYLEYVEERPEYLAEHMGVAVDRTAWGQKRRSLASQLLEKVARLEEGHASERDWEIRVIK